MQEIQKDYVVVRDKEGVNKMLAHINNHDILAFDTETDGLNPRKGKIIGFSISGEVGKGFYLPTLFWDTTKEELVELSIEGIGAHLVAQKLITLLIGKKLIMHNASFDTRFVKNFYKIDLLPSLWVETQLLIHTVQEEGVGHGVFGLKSVAIAIQEHIGIDAEKDANEEQIALKESIAKNGGATSKTNYEFYKADLDILSIYAAADTDLTLRVFYYFYQKLKDEGLQKFFFEDEVMPLYKEVTIPMEEMGVDLDMDLIRETKAGIAVELEKAKRSVIDSLMKTDAGRMWVMDSATKLFPPSNRGNWIQKYCTLKSLPLEKRSSGKFSTAAKSIEMLEDSPSKDFLQNGDADVLDEMDKIRVSMSLWKDKNDGEYFNIQSKMHLGEIVFDYMGIPALSQTDKGKNQFDDTAIEMLSKQFDWAKQLRVYNRLLKISSTYVDRFLDKQEDGRYYFYYKQHGTISGRYGSDAQQLPKPKEEGDDDPIVVEYTNRVRAFFVSGEGRKLVDCDYESLEPHVFASVSTDKGIQEIFSNGWDFYSTIAIKTEKLTGVSPDKKADNYLKKVDPSKRQSAKGYSLGIPYGMSPYALGKTLNISTKKAKALVQGYLDGFPSLAEWMEASKAQVKEYGFIKNKVGRIRHLDKVKKLYDTFGEGLLDWKTRKDLEAQYGGEVVTSWYRDYKNGLNNAQNFQIQSMAAAIVNRAAIQINRKFKEMGVDGGVQAQVHDQLIMNVPEADAERCAVVVQDIMENILELEGVTLKAPPEISKNWKEGHA